MRFLSLPGRPPGLWLPDRTKPEDRMPSASPDFTTRLRTIQAERRSVLCVGLDPDPDRLPHPLRQGLALPEAILAFNTAIIEATAPSACAFKLNFAFFEIMGRDGWAVLEETIARIPEGTLIVADAKRGDIGNSARFYAEAVFTHLGCDAITVAPYMGEDSVTPFLQYPGRAAFVLARTSNPGAANFQECTVEGRPLFAHVARAVASWGADAPGTAGLVVGATDAHALAQLRAACPTLPFLIPGIGAQGGDAEAVRTTARTDEGLVLVNSSRQILYASDGDDFAEAAAREAEALRRQLEGRP